MLLPALARAKARAQRINCVNNLKQVGLSFRTWALDNQDRFPMTVPPEQGGASEHIGVQLYGAQGTFTVSKGVYGVFQVMSNELSTPAIVFCPSEFESTRTKASSFASVSIANANATPFTNDYNVSYFLGIDAQDTNPQMFLAGDHNMGNGNPPTALYIPKFVSIGTNFTTGIESASGIGHLDLYNDWPLIWEMLQDALQTIDPLSAVWRTPLPERFGLFVDLGQFWLP